MKILIAAGGTGGHIIPAIAVAQAISELAPTTEITFVGIGKPIEEKLVKGAGYSLRSVAFVPALGGGVKGILKLVVSFPVAFSRAVKLLRELRPDVVIGFGGFPSFVPFIAAAVLKIPTILHEQNVQVGLANKVLSLFADKIFAVTGARGFWSNKAVTHLPNPVRKQFNEISDVEVYGDNSQLTVLVVGGSQGAVAVNSAVLALSDFFERHGVAVIHQTGSLDLERVKKGYAERGFSNVELLPFIDDIDQAYARSQLVICRAGAMTVAEVSAAGRAAIFIPLPIAGGHQAENVRTLCEAGGGICLDQDDRLIVVLREKMQELISKPQKLQKMATSARAHSMSGGEPSAVVIARTVLQEAARGASS